MPRVLTDLFVIKVLMMMMMMMVMRGVLTDTKRVMFLWLVSLPTLRSRSQHLLHAFNWYYHISLGIIYYDISIGIMIYQLVFSYTIQQPRIPETNILQNYYKGEGEGEEEVIISAPRIDIFIRKLNGF